MQNDKEDFAFHIDMHVHTSRYSECAESLDPRQIEAYAQKTNVHGIVITEHDTVWSKDQFEELQQELNSVILYNGIEVTTMGGYHLVIVGVSENGPLTKRIPCDEAIVYAHEQEGIVILAHPFRNGLPLLNVLEKVDAIEIGSTSLSRRESQLAVHLATTIGKPMIGCSDAHALSRIGWAYTCFPEKPESLHHLCWMIKEGQGKPVLPSPFFS